MNTPLEKAAEHLRTIAAELAAVEREHIRIGTRRLELEAEVKKATQALVAIAKG